MQLVRGSRRSISRLKSIKFQNLAFLSSNNEWINALGASATGSSFDRPSEADIAIVRKSLNAGVLSGSEYLTKQLVNHSQGTVVAMKLRDCVNVNMQEDKKRGDNALLETYKSVNRRLINFLSISFSVDKLRFERVTFHESSGMMLEKVAEQDSVLNRVRTLRDLKKRLGEGRRCYALIHPHLPNDPIAFIHVALTQTLAPSLSYLDEHCREELVPTHAMFYSVNAPHSSLGGLDLATRIIKLAVSAIKEEFPPVMTFSTLSPVPGFMGWLAGARRAPFPPSVEERVLEIATARGEETWEIGSDHGAKALATMLSVISDPESANDKEMLESLRKPLHWLGSYYLIREKQGCSSEGLPYDPVARFHLRNGASLERVNPLGNLSNIGLKRSGTLMCNYVYSLSDIQERHEEFVNSEPPGAFHVSTEALEVLN